MGQSIPLPTNSQAPNLSQIAAPKVQQSPPPTETQHCFVKLTGYRHADLLGATLPTHQEDYSAIDDTAPRVHSVQYQKHCVTNTAPAAPSNASDTVQPSTRTVAESALTDTCYTPSTEGFFFTTRGDHTAPIFAFQCRTIAKRKALAEYSV